MKQLNENTNRSKIFRTIIERLDIRRTQSTFSPKAEQKISYDDLKGQNLFTGGNVNGEITLAAWECAWIKEQ